MRYGCVAMAMATALWLAAAGAGAGELEVLDVDELKRLARLDTSARLREEAVERARQLAEAQTAQPANRQAGVVPGPAPSSALSGAASQLQKLSRGIEAAHAAAPTRWYQAARIEDITPPGDDNRKIYKITGVLGSYCLRYPDKNKTDQEKAYVGEPLLGACPHMF